MTQQVHRGIEGSGPFLSHFLASTNPNQILLVCKPNSFRASGADAWFSKSTQIPTHIFSNFSPNPKEGDAQRGVEEFNRISASGIIAVGGGSVLDMAKLINYFGSRNSELNDVLRTPPSSVSPLRPLLAIPTTAGSGSEATHFAVLYRDQIKYSIANESIRPSHVLLIPEFTHSMDAYQTACTGMDAIAQSVESLWARGCTDESRAWARESLRLALDHLPAAVHAPTPEHRAGMLEAAHLAGRAIDISKTTAAHAFSYILTSTFGLPHGHAVALLLPYFIGFHKQAGVDVEGLDEPTIRSLLQQIHLAQKLPISKANLFHLLLQNVNMERLENNPIAVSKEWIQQLASGLASE